MIKSELCPNMKCTLNVNIYKNTAFPYLLARVLRRSVVKYYLHDNVQIDHCYHLTIQ